MKEPKKVKVGKRLVEWNRRKREELTQVSESQSEPKLTSSQYYGAGVIASIGMLGVFRYCIYQYKKTSKETSVNQTDETTVHQTNETTVH